MSFIYDMIDTWDAGGTTFTAVKMNVTDTASAAGSLLMDLQVGGVSKEKTDKGGNKTLSGSHTSAGFLNSISTKIDAYPVTSNDYTILGDATTAAFSVTLPAAPLTGQLFNIKKIDASVNVVTIAGNGKNIDGSATKLLATQYASAQVQYDGTAWFIL